MIVLINSATPTFYLSLLDGDKQHDYSYEAGRELAQQIFTFLDETLAKHDKTINDITAIGVYQGPGSFTGLRIGITVANTLAESLGVPIVGTSSTDNWQSALASQLASGENEHIVLPNYGAEANITKPRK